MRAILAKSERGVEVTKDWRGGKGEGGGRVGGDEWSEEMSGVKSEEGGGEGEMREEAGKRGEWLSFWAIRSRLVYEWGMERKPH